MAAELALPRYSQLIGDRPLPATPVPLLRRWNWQAPGGRPLRVISAVGVAPSLDAGRVFVVEKNGLRLFDPSSGLPRWSADLGGTGHLGRVSLRQAHRGDAAQIVALELGQGEVQWRYDLTPPGKTSTDQTRSPI